ncbi:deoxynucleoside kinase, partial [Undibacterium sp. CCC2.1]|nr:deoxynucleoside kinase [Undibacterium sp. CCC2.1]
MESGITLAYLKRLCESYSRFFYDYEAAPLLIVNNQHMDLSGNDGDFALLLDRIESMRGK